MTFTRRSPWTNKLNTMELDVTPQQFIDWTNGTFIQDAMPNLTDDEREFILNGMTPEDSAAMQEWMKQTYGE